MQLACARLYCNHWLATVLVDLTIRASLQQFKFNSKLHSVFSIAYTQKYYKSSRMTITVSARLRVRNGRREGRGFGHQSDVADAECQWGHVLRSTYNVVAWIVVLRVSELFSLNFFSFCTY